MRAVFLDVPWGFKGNVFNIALYKAIFGVWLSQMAVAGSLISFTSGFHQINVTAC